MFNRNNKVTDLQIHRASVQELLNLQHAKPAATGQIEKAMKQNNALPAATVTQFSNLLVALPTKLFGFQILQEEEKAMELKHAFQFINSSIIHLEMTLGHAALTSISFI